MPANRSSSGKKPKSECIFRPADSSDDKSNHIVDPALLGFLSARYYRREAVEHFLRKWHHRVPLSIQPPWFAKILVILLVITLIATIGLLHKQVDLSTSGKLVSVAGHVALVVPAAAPVTVGTALTVSGIGGEVKVVSIERALAEPEHRSGSGVSPTRTDSQVVRLDRGPLPSVAIPVSVRLKRVRLITLFTIAFEKH